MLELSRIATSPVEAPWCSDALLTQSELPEKPESGSSGSSTTQPLQVTSERTAKALLGSVLMNCVDRLASRADKAGRRPIIMCHHDLGIDLAQKLPCRCWWPAKLPTSKSRPRGSRHDWRWPP